MQVIPPPHCAICIYTSFYKYPIIYHNQAGLDHPPNQSPYFYYIQAIQIISIPPVSVYIAPPLTVFLASHGLSIVSCACTQ